jgi:hypothetical protein
MADKVVMKAEIKSNIGEVAKDTEKLGDGVKKATKDVKKLSVSFGSLLKATGFVALLSKAFEVLKETFGKNQKVVDIFNTSMTALSIAFNDLFGFIEKNIGTVIGYFEDLFENPVEKIEELGKAITEGLYNRFIELLDVVGLVGKAFIELVTGDFSKAFDTIKQAGKETVDVFTGVDESFDEVADTIVKYTTETLKQADAITQTAKAADRAAVEFAKLNAQYLKDAEVQRQIRDDETKTFEERIEANNKLNEILAEQQKLQREQVQIGIDAAQQQYDINASEENYIALQEAKVAMLELEETITGQLSEQKTNAVALEKELLETQNEVRAEGLSGLQRELEELKTAYELKKEMARKSGMETTAIDAEYAKQRKSIVVANVNDQIDAYAGLANALIGLAGENKELAVASAIIDTFVGANKALSNAPPPLNYINMAAVIATGLGNVSKIMQTDVGSGGGGASAPATSTPAPQMMSGAFDISGGVAPEAAKAYVVTDEMTNSQNQLANIRRRATI